MNFAGKKKISLMGGVFLGGGQRLKIEKRGCSWRPRNDTTESPNINFHAPLVLSLLWPNSLIIATKVEAISRGSCVPKKLDYMVMKRSHTEVLIDRRFITLVKLILPDAEAASLFLID